MPNKEQKEFLSPADVAREISISRQTVLRWLNEGSLIGYKFDRSWRINRTDFKEFMESHKNQPE